MTQRTTRLEPTVDVRRKDERFATRLGWLDSKHSFSFGHHYDPANTHFGLLLVNNDDVVSPGTGFETHPHRDMEIVTWVLRGQLVHQDSQGHSGIIYPGLAQRMSAGTGILHSEKNDAWRLSGGGEHQEPVHFVQMWVVPDEAGIKPGYEQLEIDDELLEGGLVPVASGMDAHARRRRHPHRNGTPRCTPPGSRPASPSGCPTPPSCTSSWPRATSPWRAPARSPPGTPSASPRAAARSSPRRRPAEVLVWEMHAGLATS